MRPRRALQTTPATESNLGLNQYEKMDQATEIFFFNLFDILSTKIYTMIYILSV